jgi:hypothetical protein
MWHILVKLSIKNKKFTFMPCVKCNLWKKAFYLSAINLFDCVCTFQYERSFVQSGERNMSFRISPTHIKQIFRWHGWWKLIKGLVGGIPLGNINKILNIINISCDHYFASPFHV